MKRFVLVLGFILLSACATSPSANSDKVKLINTYLQLTRAYMAQGRNDLALERAKRALELAPDNYKTNFVYGLALQQNREYKLAGEHIMRALSLSNDKFLPAKNAYGVNLCLQGEYERGQKILTDLIRDKSYATPKTARDNLKKCHG